MSARLKNTKDAKQLAVSMAVLEVIEKDGLLGVTHSKVARKSGVSRAWIYEYVGKDKNAFIEFAAESIASVFARIKMNLPDTKEQLQQQLREGIGFLFDSVIHDPVTIKIYFRFRGTSNPIGAVIRKYETKWLSSAAKSASKILGIPLEQAALFAELTLILRLGFAHNVATSETPKDSRKRAEEIFEYIHSLFAL